MSLRPEAEFHIRNAEEDELDAIRDLILHAGINPTKLDWRNFLVAESEDGEFLGCGQVKQHADGSEELASLAVEKEHQGRGIGSALISALLEQHPGRLYLMCQASMGALYERYGFQTIDEAEMPTYFRRVSQLPGVLGSLAEQGESLLIMRRESA